MNKTKTMKFIDFLDNYSKQIENQSLDYKLITSIINFNYVEGQLYKPEIVGNTTINTNEQQLYYYPDNYYSYFSKSIWNNSSIDPSGGETQNIDNYNINDEYAKWQREHEINTLNTINMIYSKPYSNEPEKPCVKEPLPIIKTKYKEIDTSMNSINDILTILDENEYDEATEYNIDLKSLCNIKMELIELNNMIGLESFKQSLLEQLIYFLQNLHLGKNVSEFKHTAIFGPPGTGKTEIAKIIGRMYSKLGILKNNYFKKVTRNDLIAGYLGQTAIKTRKVIDECLGGVLFIDEAYSLASEDRNDSFSKECIDILCEALSDHKDELMVIIAGYEQELNDTFFRTNQGLESRFIWRLSMEAYNAKEMMQIFKKKIVEQEWCFENDTTITERWFNDKMKFFKNYGRDMELLLVYTKIAHGKRVYGKPVEMRKKISLADLEAGYKTFTKNKNIKKEPEFLSSIYI
jgi:SpoVK/Ycf46/Vps4 family AAA+-type ATPase